MEKKTFAFRLAAKWPGDTGKWKARDGVALAGCSWVHFSNSLYRYVFPGGGVDNGPYC